MNAIQSLKPGAPEGETGTAAADTLLSPLLQGPALAIAGGATAALPSPVHGVVIGALLATTDGGTTAWVNFAGQPGHAALPARTMVDLHGVHIGKEVVLMFEQGDPGRPIVMGVVRASAVSAVEGPAATVDVDADGRRMVVSAHEQLVLRCGKASITLTKAGKVVIDGTYVSSTSTGVNRVKGGSVQLN